MLSKILGKLPLDAGDLAREAERLERLPFEVGYAKYVFGRWSNCVLWNGSGDASDGIIHEYRGRARATANARGLRLVDAIIHEHFDVEHLRWARIFRMEEGVLLPHRDYVDMTEGYTRLHVPLVTHESCLHSEEDSVFHMRASEVWFLDATNVHGACNLATRPRLSLCLDFDPRVPMQELVRAAGGDRPEPHLVARPPLDAAELLALQARAAMLSDATFDETVAALAKVHFRRQANAAAMFGWLAAIARRSGHADLVERARALTAMALGDDARVRAVA